MTAHVNFRFILLFSCVIVSSTQKPKSWFSFLDWASPTTSTTLSPVRTSTLVQTPTYNAVTSRPLIQPDKVGLNLAPDSTKRQSITPQLIEPTRTPTIRTSLETTLNRAFSTTPTTSTTNRPTQTTSTYFPVGWKSGQKPDIIFPDSNVETGSPRVSLNLPADSESIQQIPTTLLEQLDQAGNLDDFMRLVDNAPSGLATQPETEEDWAQVDGRFGWTETERNSEVINPKPAGCTPTNETVPVSSSENPLVVYYPTCTRVERCSGCCSSRLLTCEPTKTETLLLRVVRTEYAGGTRLSKPIKEIIPVERHLACKCQCRVKELDCSKFQVYDANSCTCKCTNLDDKLKCETENRTRIWDNKDCVCRCREKGQCSTGYFFDETACQCESFATDRHGANARVQPSGNRGRAPVSTMRFDDPNLSFKKDDDYDSEDKPHKSVEKVQLNKPHLTWH